MYKRHKSKTKLELKRTRKQRPRKSNAGVKRSAAYDCSRCGALFRVATSTRVTTTAPPIRMEKHYGGVHLLSFWNDSLPLSRTYRLPPVRPSFPPRLYGTQKLQFRGYNFIGIVVVGRVSFGATASISSSDSRRLRTPDVKRKIKPKIERQRKIPNRCQASRGSRNTSRTLQTEGKGKLISRYAPPKMSMNP